MFTMTYLLFCILLLLGLGAVIAFSFFVVKPLQTRWAIDKAHKILMFGDKARDDWQFRNVYRILATARNDMEATKLWQQLDRMR
jgi:hypothetical protein